MSTLSAKQANMKKRQSGAVHEVALHRRKRMSRPEPEWIGAKTRDILRREALSTLVRDLRARLDAFKDRRREQNAPRAYAVEIRTVSPDELAGLDTPGSVFRLQ